jgi:sugar transferase EpsL
METKLGWRIKRVADIVISLLLLTTFLAPLGATYLLIRLESTGPGMFRQQRPGQKCRKFIIYKFRTMIMPVNPNFPPSDDHNRITKIGRFLRTYSLDELPELWNVLKGDMSLVGPRPLLIEYVDLYSPAQSRRHEMPPGITGWAQVNGRNIITWEKKFRLDTWYIENWSMWLDIKILMLTVIKTIRREGINQPGKATMEKFTGNGESHDKQIS